VIEEINSKMFRNEEIVCSGGDNNTVGEIAPQKFLKMDHIKNSYSLFLKFLSS